jgi:hypothetical protein
MAASFNYGRQGEQGDSSTVGLDNLRNLFVTCRSAGAISLAREQDDEIRFRKRLVKRNEIR